MNVISYINTQMCDDNMHPQRLTGTFTSTTHEHMDGRHRTRTARHHAHATQQSKVQCWSSRREGYGRAPNHGLRPRGWPMRPDAKPAPHADAVSQGGVEVCKGREGGTPAPAGCRRRTRCRTRAGGLAPPCGPSDHLQGTSGRVGRSHAGPERPPRRACRNRGVQGR